MTYQPLVPATLTFNPAGVPYAPAFDDIYHSESGGLEQARHVFLGGNGLPRGWQGREQFIVLETGFGLGLNFLATWQAWRDDPLRCERLHFVSVEKHPFERDDLAHLHSRWPELAALADELQAQWPVSTPGVHRLLFDSDSITLTLLFGDAVTQLRKLSLQADALYLDGFAPSKNHELWDRQFLKGVTRLCGPGATLATWTVAAPVREGLSACRWSLEKRAGFGSKRDMLCGRLHGHSVRPEPFDNGQGSPVEDQTVLAISPLTSSGRTVVRTNTGQHAIVIGAGIAGCAIAERLAARGWRIDLLERHAVAANEASGNPVGLLHPMLARDDNLAARLSRAGYLYSLRLLAQLDAQNLGLRWSRCGILQLARDEVQEAAQRDVVEALHFPADYVAFVDSAEAARLTGHDVAAGGWFYPSGAIVNPPGFCRALLARYGERICANMQAEVDRLDYLGGQWQAIDADGGVLASAPTAIVANAFDAIRLIPHCDLPLSRLRGQISMLPHGTLPFVRHALCGNGYVTPDTLGGSADVHCIGATFDMDDEDTEAREDSHRFNLERLAELLPGVDVGQFDPARLEGRVAFRTMAIDRMPIVGALPDNTQNLKPGAQLRDVARVPGLFILTALGSRGLAWGPLVAELLASQLCNEPLPLERDLISAIDPGRFAIRKQRRAFGFVSGPQDL